MESTFNYVKNKLIGTLNDGIHDVIVLKGKWGTGKSYLWDKIEKDSSIRDTKPIYVSLFGAKNINELKIKILQSAWLKDKKTTQKVISEGANFTESFIKRFTGYSIENALLLSMPNILKNHLIIIDDIERKNKSLDIDDLLGFIDEYSKNHETKFLVILNTDKLTEVDIWKELHEKVIDIELTLDPTPSESFDNASSSMESNPYASDIKSVVSILKINNIRVIKRIIRIVNNLLKESGMSDIPPNRWIPSTALLVSSHFHGIENPPTYEFLKSFNQYKILSGDKNTIRNTEWETMLINIGIPFCGDYEDVLHVYLQTGNLEIEKLKTLFENYKEDASRKEIKDKVQNLLSEYFWNHHRSKEELAEMAKALLPELEKLDATDVTQIVNVVDNLDNPALGRNFLDEWLGAIEKQPGYKALIDSDFDLPRGTTLHPEIVQKIRSLQDKDTTLTLMDVARIPPNVIWTKENRNALHKATTQDYEDVIKKITNETFRNFCNLHLEWARQGSLDEKSQQCVQKFISACSKLYSENPESRLASSLYYVFELFELTKLLESGGN